MVKINLSTYNIILLNTQNDENVILDEITYGSLQPDSQPKSIMELLFKFLSNKKEESPFIRDNKVLYIKDFNVENENKFFGEFLYGTSGSEHPVRNINEDSEELIITKDQSILTPYYFYIEIPKNSKQGLLILESKGTDGIKTLFEGWFGTFITKQSNTNLKLELKSFLPEKIINTYLDQGVLKKIRFLSSTLPVDTLDILDGYEPEEGYVELKIQINKDNRKPIIDKIKKLINNKSDESKEYGDIIGNGLETEDIKLEIDLNGSERTFTINKLENAVPARDITDELKKGDNGHRTFESIHNKGKEYADDIFRSSN